ncbi:recombinase family protein [Anaeromyxobacter sp. SG26]|uniref:recombinase family protein n=1 Tax=Anaeromyxobacter sp. SG26 TaxID=2925407 RepID=UPI001F56595B|nr:recombinase family protein [Anaeromyxobacter sp. SG26]
MKQASGWQSGESQRATSPRHIRSAASDMERRNESYSSVVTATAKPLAVAYLRVSTAEQTTANQREEVVRLAGARGYRVEVVEETGSAVKRRPALDAVMDRARRGEVRALVVVALDRIDRDHVAIVARVAELDRVGCAVISVREPWTDTSGPTRGLLVSVFGWVAEQERRVLIERTKAGIARARRENKKLGRPSVMLPCDVEKAKGMRAKGATWVEVGAALDVNADTVRLASKNW